MEERFRLGRGGFRGLSRSEQLRLLAYHNVVHDPEGRSFRPFRQEAEQNKALKRSIMLRYVGAMQRRGRRRRRRAEG